MPPHPQTGRCRPYKQHRQRCLHACGSWGFPRVQMHPNPGQRRNLPKRGRLDSRAPEMKRDRYAPLQDLPPGDRMCPVKDKHAAEFQSIHATAALDRGRRAVAGRQPEPVQHLDQEFLFGDIGDRRAGRQNQTALAVPERSREGAPVLPASTAPRWQIGPTVEVMTVRRSCDVIGYDYENPSRNLFRRSYC